MLASAKIAQVKLGGDLPKSVSNALIASPATMAGFGGITRVSQSDLFSSSAAVAGNGQAGKTASGDLLSDGASVSAIGGPSIGTVDAKLTFRLYALGDAGLSITCKAFATGQATLSLDAQLSARTGQAQFTLDAATFLIGSAVAALPLRAGALIGTGTADCSVVASGFMLGTMSTILRAQVSSAPDWSNPSASANFSLAVMIAGAVVQTTGAVDISGEESSAMLASCRIPAPPAWTIGDSMTVDLIVSAHVTRLFAGQITEVQYDPANRLSTINASDGFQTLFDAMSNAAIDALTPGATTTPGNTDTGFAYLNHRLSSVPASLDLDVSGTPQLTRFDEGKVLVAPVTGAIDGSENITLVRADQLINRVDLTVQASWVRLAQAQITMRWQSPWTLCQTFGYGMNFVPTVPAIGEIQSVFEATGWQVDRYFEEPYLTRATGVVQCPSSRGPVPVPLLDGAGTTSIKEAAAVISKRYSRSMQASAAITMTVQESINQFGEHKQTVTANYRDEQDDKSFLEPDTSTVTDGIHFIVGGTPPPPPPILDATDPNGDAIHDALDATALDGVITDAMNRALVDVAKAHRASRIGATMPIRPDITRTHRITLDLPSFTATGKVTSLRHTLDTDSGSALTEVSCALFMGGDGQPIGVDAAATDFSAATVATRSNAIDAITNLATHVGALKDSPAEDDTWTGWIINAEPPETGALNIYQSTGFLIKTPDITLPDQAEPDIKPTANWRVHLPLDPITYK